jgi:hypothetical protein
MDLDKMRAQIMFFNGLTTDPAHNLRDNLRLISV